MGCLRQTWGGGLGCADPPLTGSPSVHWHDMVTGLNHTTFAVRDLDASFLFYTELLGLRPVARWSKGAYFTAGEHWFCLNLDPATRTEPLPEYTHLAFSVAANDLSALQVRLEQAGVIRRHRNRSPGDSFYFLDPDGHKLEIHGSGLEARLNALRANPPEGLTLFTKAADPIKVSQNNS